MFKLEIRTGGAAFRDESQTDETGNAVLDADASEVRRILASINDKLVKGYTSGKVIGEGDSLCDATGEIVLADWEPTKHFMGPGCPYAEK